MDLKSLSIEELRDLISQAHTELASRSELVVYTHDCSGSARYHLGKYKHWAKLVKSVDESKTNGYAWIGDFLSVERENKIPSGSLVAEVCGSAITVYRVTSEGKEKIGSASTSAPSSLIEKVASLI